MKRIGLLLSFLAQSPALAQPVTNDPKFRADYDSQYQHIQALRPDMLVEEFRLRVELVTSRGSQVGAASNARRVRGFESALLQKLQAGLCGGAASSASSGRPAPMVVDAVAAAANDQRLRTVGSDMAELSAMTQRLLDTQAKSFCTLQSLDDVR